MADSVQELIIKYRSDTTELQAKLDEVERKLREIEAASKTSGSAVGQNLNSQAAVVDSLSRRIYLLKEAREKSNDPIRTQRLNNIIQEQSRRVDELKAKTQSAGNAFTKTFSGINAKPLTNQFASLGNQIAGAFAVQQVLAFAGASVRAFQEAEKQALILRNAVSVNGGLQGDFEELIEQSSQLESKSIFSDDAIQQAQTAALQFGLTKDEVKELIPIVADFASATGQDLSTALNAVLQGVNGAEKGLKKFGVTISENGNRQTRLAEITTQLNKKFEDQAEAVGETAAGAAAKYANELDNLQEGIGERAAPILQDLRSLFLDLASAGVSAAEGVRELFSSTDSAGDGITKILEANKAQIESFRRQFESLSTDELNDKLDTSIRLFNEQIEKSKTESGIQLSLTRQLAVEYSNQAKALRELLSLRQQGIDTSNQEEVALKKAANLASLTTKEIEDLRIKLSGFNSIAAADAIDGIDKELEARKKGNEKIAEEKAAALEKLHEQEQKASDDNLAIKAAEVDKVIELEQKKQTAIRDLVVSAGKASGARVEPILLEFNQTGSIDIERTLKLLENANFPVAEIEKFKTAVDNIAQSFSTLQEKFIQDKNIKSLVDQLTQSLNDIESKAATTADDIEKEFEDREVSLVLQFEQSGDRSTEGFDNLNAQLVALDNEKNLRLAENQEQADKDKLDRTKRTNDQIILLDEKLVVDTSDLEQKSADSHRAVEQEKLKGTKDRIKAEVDAEQEKLQAQEELLEKQRDLIREVRDAAIGAAEEMITNSIDAQADAELDATEEVRDKKLESIEEEIRAAEDQSDAGIISARQEKAVTEQLLVDKKKAEETAAREISKIKRKQFEQDQFAAIAKVLIAAQVAAAEAGFNPILTALYEGLALIQIGVIAARPNPYKKGTKKSKKGLALVGEEGPELMNLPEGTQVLSNPKTKKRSNKALIDAMIDDDVDAYIQKQYVKPEILMREIEHEVQLRNLLRSVDVAPAMKAAERRFEEKKQENFAANIANSFLIQKESGQSVFNSGPSVNDLDWIRRQGTYLRNADEIAEGFAQRLAKIIQSNTNPRRYS